MQIQTLPNYLVCDSNFDFNFTNTNSSTSLNITCSYLSWYGGILTAASGESKVSVWSKKTIRSLKETLSSTVVLHPATISEPMIIRFMPFAPDRTIVTAACRIYVAIRTPGTQWEGTKDHLLLSEFPFTYQHSSSSTSAETRTARRMLAWLLCKDNTQIRGAICRASNCRASNETATGVRFHKLCYNQYNR